METAQPKLEPVCKDPALWSSVLTDLTHCTVFLSVFGINLCLNRALAAQMTSIKNSLYGHSLMMFLHLEFLWEGPVL